MTEAKVRIVQAGASTREFLRKDAEMRRGRYEEMCGGGRVQYLWGDSLIFGFSRLFCLHFQDRNPVLTMQKTYWKACGLIGPLVSAA